MNDTDLIRRQDAIDALGEEPLVWSECDEYDVATRNQWRYDIECIKDVPSVELERQKGEWHYHIEDPPYCQDSAVQCSLCGRVYFCEEFSDWRYCPSCGAYMGEDRDEM